MDNKLFFSKLVLLSFLVTTFFCQQAFSWGERGHHTICEAAVYLLQDAKLKNIMLTKTHVMGHLCNIPDIYWKSLKVNKMGNSSHYLNPEIIGLTVKNLPLDLQSLEKKYKGTPNQEHKESQIKNVAQEMGSLWWRAQQLYNLAIQNGQKKPADTYEMFTNMGILGHFAGDASMPLHNTADSDGWKNGHGGIHRYYEALIPSYLEPELVGLVVEQATKMRVQKEYTYFKPHSVLENMKKTSEIAYSDIDELYKLDKVLKPSEFKSENGIELKLAAHRDDPNKVAPIFKPLIIKELALSANLLAQLWEEIYSDSGKPIPSESEHLKYPLTPKFVPVDYTLKEKQ